MPFQFELGPKVNSTGNAELTPAEQALENIFEHIEDAGLDSVRWKAFADYTDFFNARARVEVDYHEDRTLNQKEIRLALIEERVMQRRNEIPRYEKESREAARLTVELENALLGDAKRSGSVIKSVATNLMTIRDQAIDRRSQ